MALPMLLICDDDSTFHLAVKHSLKGQFECRSAYNGDEALTIFKKQPVDIILMDVQMRTPDEGLKTIPRLLEVDPNAAIVMSSGMIDFGTVREAMRLGAIDYVPKDFDPNELLHTIRMVLERRALVRRQEQQNFEVVRNQNQHVLIGNSPSIVRLKAAIEKIRASTANVVITGDTGTGKEVVARQLRKTLPDGSLAPFVAIDSATIQSSTAESILFGHEKGAFTGAERATKGIFEEADGGIVYFDEIANMPLDIQSKLLRVLQEKEISRLGSSRVIKLDFRVVCATNKNLDEMSKAGLFKDDLLQRLSVLPVNLSPLKERVEDVSLLVDYFLSKQGNSGSVLKITDDALEVLKAYSWPGNVRELGNLIAYLITMTEGTEVDVADLPPKLRDSARPASTKSAAAKESDIISELGDSGEENFYAQVARREKEILKSAYDRFEGNISKLALKLGMDRSHLYTKLKEFGLHSGKSRSEKD